MIDIHSHILPHIDDGSCSLDITMQMIKETYLQGVRSIFCTSHSEYIVNNIEQYKSIFQQIKKYAKIEFPKLNLYIGSEVFCTKYNIHNIIS